MGMYVRANLFKIRRLGSRKKRHPHYQTGNDTAGLFLSHPKCHIVTNECDNRVSRNKLLNGGTVELESKFRKIYEIGANIQDA